MQGKRDQDSETAARDAAAAAALLIEHGYRLPHRLPSGEWAALLPLLFTTGLVVGLDPFGIYRTRFCYPAPRDAFIALVCWSGQGNPPGPWIKEKGLSHTGQYVDRNNPATCAHRLRDGNTCIDCKSEL